MRPPTPPREHAGDSPAPTDESAKPGRRWSGDAGEGCGADGSGGTQQDGADGSAGDSRDGEGVVDVASAGRRSRSAGKRGTAGADAGGQAPSPARRLSLETISEDAAGVEDRDSSGNAAAGDAATATGATGGGGDDTVGEETEDDGE